MPQKKKASKKARRRRESTPPRPYVMPKTAAELGITCSLCGSRAVWFDYGRGQRDHRAGFVCDAEPAIGQRERLLIKEQATAAA